MLPTMSVVCHVLAKKARSSTHFASNIRKATIKCAQQLVKDIYNVGQF
jgi:hypothetical protein